jgi:murein DD-endopeptidase MepM/ murein hydrolase activator NlpD
VRLRSLSLALLISILLTGLAGLPMASADPGDPTPDPSPTSDPTPTPDPTTDPTPDPEPTKPPPDDEDPPPSPTPPPDNDGKDGKGKGKGKQGQDGKQDGKRNKRDPFAMAGPQNTARLVSLLAGLTQRGISLEKAFLKVVGPFPVAGLAWWTDDWHACRDGCSRLHKGLDIFAPYGTPLVAAADGYISQKVNAGLAGLGLEITDAHGIQYFYAHLSAFEPGIEAGTQVEVGQVVGYVGDSGNARGTIPHVHFEYQPGGVPAPPKPWVDRWLRLAERKAIGLVQEVTGTRPKVERLTFRLTRLFDLVDGERTDLNDAALGDGGELLALAGLHPAATYDMARDTAGTMAWEIDWGEEAVDQIATGVQEYQQELTEQTLMGILQDPETEHAEGIGDPTAPVATEGGGMAIVPAAPGEVSTYGEMDAGAGSALPIGAPGAEVAETSSGSSGPSIGRSSPPSSFWRTSLGPGLVRVLTAYGALSTTLPGLTETLWHEIVVAIQDQGARGLLRDDTEARFPSAAGTP